MRRGHPGLGGWRNENPRHYRTRNGGNQHYRASRGYGLLDQHRFPPPISRPHRPSQSYKQRLDIDDRNPRHDRHDRGKYRTDYRQNNYQRNQDESHLSQETHMYSVARPIRTAEIPYNNSNTYSHGPPNYYEGLNKHCHMNSLGDIDDRYIPPREPFKQNTISPWASDSNLNKYDDRAHKYEHNKSHRFDGGESSKLPLHDYTGHRPPSNDHYGGNPTPVINNSGSFNRSVDDTVDLIRKRLLNRNDPHPSEYSLGSTNDPDFGHNRIESPLAQKSKECIQNFNPEQPSKKKVNRQRQSTKSSNDTSFTKIKSKIVNQLFKMDKEKIHKLMDNPNSSSKFEYAIDSLITESQYSFNRHLRSVAEKSLHTSSSLDFIQNDNNTIYEDTFMKQMQCILDPQDTVLLEDIKPIVMAELSKALQLDEYDQQSEAAEDELHQQRYEQPNYGNEYYDGMFPYDDCTPYSNDQKFSISQIDLTESQSSQEKTEIHYEESEKNHSTDYDTAETVNESQSRRRSRTLSHERPITIESPQYIRKSLDGRLNVFTSNTHSNTEKPLYTLKPESPPLFVSNAEPLEDEDDPFAELDKQYHVAVDHSFIVNDDSSSLHLDKDYVQPSSQNDKPNIPVNLNTPEKQSIKQEIDNQLQSMANSPLKLPAYVDNQHKPQIPMINKTLQAVKNNKKIFDNTIATAPANLEKPTSTKGSEEIEFKETNKESENSDTTHIIPKNSIASTSRKRSIDQSPSHRKEKRKKSNSVCHDTDKQMLNKNTVITPNVNYIKLSKKDQEKQSFPEKHTKRKECQKRQDQKLDETRKKRNSTDIFNSSVSPKEVHYTVNCKSQNKSELKTTLKTFDLFTKQPKKVTVHHAHRNTAIAPASNIKTISEPKSKKPAKSDKKGAPIEVGKNMQSVQTQTIEPKNTCTRFSQTDRKKYVSKAIQSNIEPLTSIKNELKIITDPLERMKEIDLEIQDLLQEKFKIYNSIETKEACTSSLPTLGMAVLNYPLCKEELIDNLSVSFSEESINEDTIVDDFTSIPAGELEQIAFETLENKEVDNSKDVNDTKEIGESKPAIRNTRLRVLEREKSKSQSPTLINQKKTNKKGKTPNISLIEQIISDERPIEDIISLDDLEHTPMKKRTKNIKSKRKSKRKGPVAVRTSTPPNSSDLVVKDCSVLIIREDFSKYLPVIESVNLDDCPNNTASVIVQQNNLQEDPIVNDIHFDMLDVSEDIVISDICEIKTVGDKEDSSTTDIPITEEIILDNSQSSVEEVQGCSTEPKENECKMFDYSSDENLRRDSVVVTGNADAVLAIECIENNFIAACLDGNVYYFNSDGQLITTLRGSNLAVTCITIVKEKYGTTVYTGSLDSRIRYYDLDTGLEKGPECNVLSPIQTMDRAWDTVFVGTRTGFVLQFECKNNMLIPISTVQFSEQSILALRAMKEGPRKVLLVAARSEDVTIKDAQTGLLLRTLVGPKMTVYTLLYEDGKIYCGTSSSQIHVFDYSSGIHVGAHEGGKGAVCLRATGGLLFAGCYDGCVYVYREGERRPFAQLRGPSLMLLSLAVVGSKIIAGYKDRSLYIWKIPLSILQEMIL